MSDTLIDSQKMMIDLQDTTIKLLRGQVDARDRLIETMEKVISNQDEQIAILTGRPTKPKLILINGGNNEQT